MNDYLRKSCTWGTPEIISNLKKSLERDLISITEIDTTYGLLGTLTEKSYHALNILKGRPSQKPYLILIERPENITTFVDPLTITPQLYAFLQKCWPGKVTVVFKVREELLKSPFLFSADQTIALRCPNHPPIQTLLAWFEGLFSTSANLSNEPVPKTRATINKQLIKQTDLLISNSENDTHSDIPSTIIDVSSLLCIDKAHNKNHAHRCIIQGEVKVIRDGAYPIETLEKLYGQKFKR